MSRRRGGRERDNGWSNFSKPSPKPRPHGLRGKNIGLFYKNLQGKRSHQDFTINLTIPPAVITALENNIKSIRKLAKECNILIPEFNGLNFIKADIKTEEDLLTDKYENDSTAKEPPNIRHSMSGPSTSTCSVVYDDTMIDARIKVENAESGSSDHVGVTVTDTPSNIENYSNFKAQPLDNTIKTENISNDRVLSLRGAGDFKYSYDDIITGTFDEKLNDCLAQGISITIKSSETDDLCLALLQDYKNMLDMSDYKKFKEFRETLPAYKKSSDLLNMINNNQVTVISGETGCGKSTQVPQLILDEAISNNTGGYVKILVTQPRRIAASSLAIRVAKERSEAMGASVGYAVRLEKVDARARGSIMFVTTGILLAALEVDQGLKNYTHIILDEVHERDCDIDLAMSMLKRVLQNRKDLKLILMSATIDAETLSAYFDNCPMIHIEGLAYPVQDVYLEDILELTKYKLPVVDREKQQRDVKPWHKYKKQKMATDMEKEILYHAEISPWLESMRRSLSHGVYKTLQDYRTEDLNLDLIHDLLVEICKGPPGAILVFLPGIADISKLLTTMNNSKCFPSYKYEIYPLHSKLPSLDQQKIFERPPDNVRKIIVATNIAETSITIDDIVYVIDSGKMKYMGLNVEDNISTLRVEWISQANLRQRRGRAGRCQPGICYHVLTSYRAGKLEERLLPEIQRNPLLEPVLALKRLRLGKAVEALDMMPSPPADKTINLAVKHLQQCGALDQAEKLTPLGWHLARLPVHPAAGKLLLLGALFGCLDRAASVAAVWGFKDPFHLVIGKEDEVDKAKRSFSRGEGSDHVAISEAIIQWERSQSKRDFAYKNFLSHNTCELLSDMKKQLGDNLKQMGFLPSGEITASWENRNKNNLILFKAIIAASLYPNVATTKWASLQSNNPNKVPRVKARSEKSFIKIHPSSILAVKPPKRGCQLIPICLNPGANWLAYWRKQRSTDLFLLEVTLVHTLPLLFFGELTLTEGTKPSECYISITSVKVCCKIRTTELLFQIRGFLDHVLASKIGTSSTHAIVKNPFEEQVLNAVIQLITAEEERADYVNDIEDFSDSDTSEYDAMAPSGRRRR